MSRLPFRRALLMLILAAILPWLLPGDDTIRIGRNEVYPKGVTSLGGHITLEGKISGSIFLIGGSLRIHGDVSEDVVCINSEVIVSSTATIQRDLIVIGGRLQKDAASKICGEFIYVRTKEDLKKILASFVPFFSETGSVMSFLKITKIILWLIVTLIILALIPAKVQEAVRLLEKAPLKIGMIGVLSFLGFILALIIFLILSLLIIGIPFLLLLIALYLLIIVFGRTVVFYLIGEKILSAFKARSGRFPPSPPVGGPKGLFIVAGVHLYALLKFQPFLGFAFILVMDVFVLGVGVGYFLRKKIFAAPASE